MGVSIGLSQWVVGGGSYQRQWRSNIRSVGSTEEQHSGAGGR